MNKSAMLSSFLVLAMLVSNLYVIDRWLLATEETTRVETHYELQIKLKNEIIASQMQDILRLRAKNKHSICERGP